MLSLSMVSDVDGPIINYNKILGVTILRDDSLTVVITYTNTITAKKFQFWSQHEYDRMKEAEGNYTQSV